MTQTAYIDRMSDYCSSCRFSPKKDCPITSLYWAFLERKSDKLAGNPRLNMPLASLKRRSPEKRVHDRQIFEQVREALASGRRLN